ncbi:MAG TPA: dUTP diphosphatase [archaeon]|nr:dUTP diphosphatase [archaeon]
MNVEVRRIVPQARLPKLEHEGDAGFDLYSIEDAILKPLERKLVRTGISIALEHGFEAQVRPKSGLAIEHGITMLNSPGTIDAGYRGEIKVIVINLGNKEYKIEAGKKICQLVFNKIETAQIVEVQELRDSKRGEGGFGSTGL